MQVHRAPLWRRVVYVVALLPASVGLAVGIARGDLPALVAPAVLLPPVLAWRLWVSRVEVGDGMRVVGLFGTRVVAWDEVAASGDENLAGLRLPRAWRRREPRPHLGFRPYENSQVARSLEELRSRPRGRR